MADLARATPLFCSRKSSTLEDFLYVPSSVIVSPPTFATRSSPPSRRPLALGGIGSRPSRSRSSTSTWTARGCARTPAGHCARRRRSPSSIGQIAPGQDYLIDNISNALLVARDDAAVGKRMFFFLGLPGVLLAAFLAAYAGRMLASTQRREQAMLRLRGANRGHLMRVLWYRTLAVAGAGSVLGVVAGLLCAVAILGSGALRQAAPGDLAARR